MLLRPVAGLLLWAAFGLVPTPSARTATAANGKGGGADKAPVAGKAPTPGKTRVPGKAPVVGKASVAGKAPVVGKAPVAGKAPVVGKASVAGKAPVPGKHAQRGRAQAPAPHKAAAAAASSSVGKPPAVATSRLNVAPVPAPAPTAAALAADEEGQLRKVDDPDGERILRMQEALNSIVHGSALGRLRVGIRVMEAGSGRAFFGQKSAVLMDPASNQKVLATTTALMRLGPAWRFRTELVGPAPDADGVVPGDLILRGSGDPSLLPVQLDALAGQLARRGVTRIDGGVYSDPRRIGSGEPASAASVLSGAGPGSRFPVRVSRGSIVVRVRPGEKAGAPASIVVSPVADAFLIDNRVQTRAKGSSRVSVSVSSRAGRMAIAVSGRISQNSAGLVLRRAPANQALYTAALVRGALVQQGVAVRDGAGMAAAKQLTAPVADLLALHESDALGVMIRRINKDSDNEYADQLLQTVGAELYGGPSTVAKGVRALRDALTELGLTSSAYVPANGSGLGHANRITADAMADLLRRIFLDPRFGSEIVQSLSVGGVDGTTRNRFRGTAAAERVRAKTGTLRGKSCLSGYVGDGSDILVFSIMCDGLRGKRLSAVRGAQVSAVNAMMRYVRGAEGTTADDAAPGIDLEGDAVQEILDSEEADDAEMVTPTGESQGQGVGVANPPATRP